MSCCWRGNNVVAVPLYVCCWYLIFFFFLFLYMHKRAVYFGFVATLQNAENVYGNCGAVNRQLYRVLKYTNLYEYTHIYIHNILWLYVSTSLHVPPMWWLLCVGLFVVALLYIYISQHMSACPNNLHFNLWLCIYLN